MTTTPDPAGVAVYLRNVLASVALGELTAASAVTTQQLGLADQLALYPEFDAS